MKELFLDGERVGGREIPVDISGGVWRGEGWFETMAVTNNTLLNPMPHLLRLSGTLPDSVDLRVTDWSDPLNQMAEDWDPRPGRLKLIVWQEENRWRSAGWITEYTPPARQQYNRGVELEPFQSSHPPRWPLAGQKRTSYAGIMEARRQTDAWDRLYCDWEGEVWESGIANICWVEGDQLHTPPLGEHILVGTVLQATIERADRLDIPVEFSRTRWRDIPGRCWLTSSGIGMLPVRTIGDHELDSPLGNPVWQALREALLSDKVIASWYD